MIEEYVGSANMQYLMPFLVNNCHPRFSAEFNINLVSGSCSASATFSVRSVAGELIVNNVILPNA
jgi:hypothetical protein